ncbi:MAG: NYN domain-containing protein [Candidatus Coatesbacteria bacterium]|nr:NYN domain-containing protein [Candidatus Coatesbacteria bacterium]
MRPSDRRPVRRSLVAFFTGPRTFLLRYSVFIDGGYAKKLLQEFNSPKICYLKFSNEVSRGYERLRTYYYDCPPFVPASPSADDKNRQRGFDNFRKALENLPRFQVRLGRLARIDTATGPKFTQKNVDILLTLDLTRLSVAGLIQRSVIVIADSDFIPAIQVAKDSGTIVELYYSTELPFNRELLEACDERVVIDKEFIHKIKA